MAKIDTIAASEARFPLAMLTLSPLNPRQQVPQAEVEELAASLWAAGLIQSIAGLPDGKGGAEIVAGGRRLRALQFLAEQHPDLAETRPDLANPLVVLAPDEDTARAWANLENIARKDLHPADEIRAYGKMAKAGADAVAIARAFAVTEKHVYRRLALAGLPAPVLDALAADEITLSNAAAFTVCNDEALALEVLDRCRGENWSDYSLKSALQPGSATTNDRRLRFVGLEAYIEAGGTTARDLFSETVYLAETDILEGLFAAKVETLKADFMAEGWAFAHFHPESYLGMIDRDLQASRMRPIPGVLTEEEAAEFDELSELEDAEALDEAGENRLAELLVKMEGDFSAEQRALSGIVFYIDQRGAVSAHAGMVRKQELAQAIAAGFVQDHARKTDEAAAPKPDFTAALTDDMRAIRLHAAQAALLDKPDLLLDLVAYALTSIPAYKQIFGIRCDNPKIVPSVSEGFEADPRLVRTEGNPLSLLDGFVAFTAKGKKHRTAALTAALARSLLYGAAWDANRPDPLFAEIEAQAGAKLRKHWTPTAAGFFSRVSGPVMEKILADLLDAQPGDQRLASFAKMKKAEKAEVMEKLFTDQTTRKLYGLTPEQIERFDNWTPACI